MDKTFLICSFPRSRTLWLSRFLSVPGLCACTHEATAHADSSAQFWAHAERLCAAEGAPVYGNCDSAQIFVLPALLAARPMSKVLWIDRPLADVRRSMEKAGFDFSSGNAAVCDWYRQRYAKLVDYVIEYSDLSNEEMMRALWDYLLSSPFSKKRWEEMKDQRIAYDAKMHQPPTMEVSGIFAEMERNPECK
jgi:hypothetical protein